MTLRSTGAGAGVTEGPLPLRRPAHPSPSLCPSPK